MFGSLTGLLVAITISATASSQLLLGWADTIAYLLLNVVAYLALSFNYFNFVNLCHTSLRIRILQELRDAGGVLSADRLRVLYDDTLLTRLRVKRLLEGRHLLASEDRLVCKGGLFLLVAKVFDGLRWAVLGPAAERPPQGCPAPDQSGPSRSP